MLRRITGYSGLAGILIGMTLAPAPSRAGVIEFLCGESSPPTLTQVARMIDHIQNSILDQGTVVAKQPDIWSQARMTMFRKEFEDTMSPEVSRFQDYLSARIARSDTASLQSQTALGAALTPFGPATVSGTPVTPPTQFTPQITNQTDLTAALTGVTGTLFTPTSSATNPGQIILPTVPTANGGTPSAAFSLLAATAPTGTLIDKNGLLMPNTALPLGLEPNIHLDEKADYINHLHRIRRVNLGDDTADSAGYGLYLMRVPISIQPGDKTKKGFGAIVNMTMRHDFGPKFLQETYRNLVINDLIDQLVPVIHELIRNGQAKAYHDAVAKLLQVKRTAHARYGLASPAQQPGIEDPRVEQDPSVMAATQAVRSVEGSLKSLSNFHPISRTGSRSYSIAPSDVKRVFVAQNLLNLAYAAQESLDLANSKRPVTDKVRVPDVGAYLRHELEGAYGLMEGRCRGEVPLLQDVEYIENLTDQVYCRKFEGPKGVSVDTPEERDEFYTLYESFTNRLPGNTRFRPIGVLCWGIAIEAGLLNRQLREDMKETKGADGYAAPPDVDTMFFYTPDPSPEAVIAFQEYVKARWPMITFALEPVTDQQNIDDAFTRRRDLQLAIAFALSAGRISFRQAIQYTRQLQYEAQTIALNQTVVGFAHGNDTFGWRFAPRYQTPPEESNFQAVTNLLLRGGPGPNWQLDNSKIEPGQRELTAVVVMPSFVRGMRLDVSGDWFRLHDPDERKLHTARTIELGRRINEARNALEAACKCGLYRPEDIERLRVRLHQLEVMLPLQTQFVKVPYENTLGGFALFDQGVTALAPELSGFEGIEYYDGNKPNDIIIYGRHFSIYESAVVVGGVALPREGSGTFTTTDANGKAQTIGTLSPLRDSNGNLYLVKPDGSTIAVQDIGSYDVLSREVIRVHIPAKVAPATREDGSQVIELYVSTPIGISNRVQIPTPPPDAPTPAKPPVLVALTPSPISLDPKYTLIDDSLTIGIQKFTPQGAPAQYAGTIQFAAGKQLRIAPIAQPTPAPSVNIWFSFVINNGLASQSIPINNVPLDPDGTYKINDKALNAFAGNLFSLLKANGFFPVSDPPQTSITSETIVVQPLGTDSKPLPGGTTTTTNNRLQINFEYILLPTAPAAGAGASRGTTAGASPRAVASRAANPATRPAAAAPVGGAGTFDPSAKLAALAQFDPSTQPAQVANAPLPFPLPPLPPQLNPAVPTIPAPVIPSTQTLVVLPRQAPSVNVSVPITNMAPAKKAHGLFHRQTGTMQATPVRGPLLERIMGRP